MNPEVIPLQHGEWLPDLPAYNNPGVTEAKNCIPQATGYRSLNSTVAFSNALTGACLGSFWLQDSSGIVAQFAGDATKLYKLTGGDTWDDVTRTTGGAYSATNWEFTKWGDRVIATNIDDVMQKFDLGTDTDFSALAGSPPQAKHIAVIRDFIMVGNLNEGGTDYPSRIRWSGFNSSELWVSSLATQSDFQDLLGRGGAIQRIVPGDVGLVFQEHSIRRITYVGPPLVFQFDEISRGRGTPAGNSVTWLGNRVFWYGQDGFQMMDVMGTDPVPIGREKVDQWFQDNSSEVVWDDMWASVDRRNKLVYWSFKSGSLAPRNDRLLIYDWSTGRWTHAELEAQFIGEYVSPGYTLDGLDTPLPNGIDTDSIPVESDAYLGGNVPSLLVFDTTNSAATLDGTPLTAVIDSAEIGGRQRVHVNSVRPIVQGNGASMTCQLGCRSKTNEAVVYSTAVPENSLGEFSVRSRGRFCRIRLNISGGFDELAGVEAYGRMGARK